MSALSDANKASTIQFFEHVFNEGKVEEALTLISPDYKFNGVPTSPDNTRKWAFGLRAKFPDLHFVIEAILAEDDKVALRWRMDATDQPSGKQGFVQGTNIIVWIGGQALTNDQGGGTTFTPADGTAPIPAS